MFSLTVGAPMRISRSSESFMDRNVARSVSVYPAFSDAILRVSPMPWPVDRYHLSASGVGVGSTPACAQSLSSFLLVPESSPRDTKTVLPASPAFSIASIAAVVSAEDFTPAGSAAGTDDHEVVVHDVLALLAVAVRDELLFVGLGVDEQDVGILGLAELERFAGAHGDDLDLVLGIRLLEGRDQHVEQPGVLSGGGRRQDDVGCGRGFGRGLLGRLRTSCEREGQYDGKCQCRRAPQPRRDSEVVHAYLSFPMREARPFPCLTLSVRYPWASCR